MDYDRLTRVLAELGSEFRRASLPGETETGNDLSSAFPFSKVIEESYSQNPWFIPQFVRYSFHAWAEVLTNDKITKWLGKYLTGDVGQKDPKKVGIIMAGNIPMVGLHDLICVLASGNHAIIRASQSDDQLIPSVIESLCVLYPGFKDRITLLSGKLRDFDAIIATGSNNTSRYFDYYFGKYPNIIRRNRNGLAVITGQEKEDDLVKLADDVFVYFGLGCRNVSKLYIPEGYDIERVLPFFEKYAFVSDLHKYMNNYDYQKSILLINGVGHFDNGFLLIREDKSLISPVSVLHTETYSSIEMLNHQLTHIADQVQCVVSVSSDVNSSISPGQSQYPELWDYADGIDTMRFLMNL